MFDEVDKLRKHRTKNWRLSKILAWSLIGQTEQLSTSSKVTVTPDSNSHVPSPPHPGFGAKDTGEGRGQERLLRLGGWWQRLLLQLTEGEATSVLRKLAVCVSLGVSFLLEVVSWRGTTHDILMYERRLLFVLWPQYEKIYGVPPTSFWSRFWHFSIMSGLVLIPFCRWKQHLLKPC